MTVVKIVHLIKHLWENFFLELIPGVYTTDSLLLDGMSGGFLVASGRAGRSRRRVHYFLERNWAGSNGFLQTLKRLATKVSSLVGRVSNSSDWAMTFRVKTQNFPPSPPANVTQLASSIKKGPPGRKFLTRGDIFAWKLAAEGLRVASVLCVRCPTRNAEIIRIFHLLLILR